MTLFSPAQVQTSSTTSHVLPQNRWKFPSCNHRESLSSANGPGPLQMTSLHQGKGSPLLTHGCETAFTIMASWQRGWSMCMHRAGTLHERPVLGDVVLSWPCRNVCNGDPAQDIMHSCCNTPLKLFGPGRCQQSIPGC